MSQDLAVATLAKLRDFLSQQLGMRLEPDVEAFGADLEHHLLALMRASTVKMNAMARVIESKEMVAAHHQAQLTELSEARNTLESERQANVQLTEENERLRGLLSGDKGSPSCR